MRRPRKRARVIATTAVRFRAYELIARAVEEAAIRAGRRALKHTDKPAAEVIEEHCYREVMGALCGVLDFGNGDGD